MANLRDVVWLSPSGDGLALAFRLKQEGHDVSVWVKDETSQDRLFRGLLRHHKTLGAALASVRPTSLLVFDGTGGGRTADRFRRQQARVIGGSKLADRLELDRSFGLEIMRRAGISVPETHEFDSFEQASDFVRNSDKRWVFKPVRGDVSPGRTFVSHDSEQMLGWLAFIESQNEKQIRFLLQEFVEGVEISTEGWFDGKRWLFPFNHTMEDKPLATGNLGPNVGCMGNVVWNVGRDRLVAETILRLTPIVADQYVGPVDINCIVNDNVWGLELTPRFGYDAIFAWVELLDLPLGETLQIIADTSTPNLPLDLVDYGFAVRMLYNRDEATNDYPLGLPIHGVSQELLRHVWFSDMTLNKAKEPVTAGLDGSVLTVTGRGPSVPQARALVYDRLRSIRVPQAYYRVDIGDRVERDIRQIADWLEPAPEVQTEDLPRQSQVR